MRSELKHLRIMSKGQWRSICGICLQTVAIAACAEALNSDEVEHKCTGVFKLRDEFFFRSGAA